jgi:hypothetical protein
MSNIIKQIVRTGEYGSQNVKLIVTEAERGKQGEQGVPGDAATITAGNAYSVPSTQQPSVINTGTASDATFDFYIPEGKKGDKGDKGEDGVVQYTAGAGIRIKNNVISVIGGGGGDVMWGDILGTISEQTDLQDALDECAKTDNLATVAFSGNYNDLSNTPSIPAAQVNSDWDATSGVAQILNKPTIPVVNDGTLTITHNGTTVATFTANSSTNATAAITTPTITMSATDPGEGQPLAENNFIAVYNAE